MSLRFLHDWPVDVDGFLSKFRSFITEFGVAMPKQDGDISSFEEALKVFRGFTAKLGIFISDMAENMDELVRILREFHELLTDCSHLVTEFKKVISELNKDIPEFDQVHMDFLGVLNDYNNNVTEFNIVLAELVSDWFINIGVNEYGVHDYVPPRVSPASEESIERLEKVRITEEETCSICLEELSVGLEATRLRCLHNFHGDCISNWLRMSEICPLCRSESPC